MLEKYYIEENFIKSGLYLRISVKIKWREKIHLRVIFIINGQYIVTK